MYLEGGLAHNLPPALASDLVPPEEVGLSGERLDRLTSYLKTEVDSARMPGAVIAISRQGQLAYFETVGYRDAATIAPMPRDAEPLLQISPAAAAAM